MDKVILRRAGRKHWKEDRGQKERKGVGNLIFSDVNKAMLR
jgi:hypothetical protein